MQLSKRETEILKHMSDGLSIQQAADKMYVSKSRAEKILASARKKLEARNNVQAVGNAVRQGLICIIVVASINGGVDMQRIRHKTRRSRREYAQTTQLYQTIV